MEGFPFQVGWGFEEIGESLAAGGGGRSEFAAESIFHGFEQGDGAGEIAAGDEQFEAGEESVGELVEEGQFFEAELMTGIEKAAEGGLTEIRTQQVPEDDVPEEYRNAD